MSSTGFLLVQQLYDLTQYQRWWHIGMNLERTLGYEFNKWWAIMSFGENAGLQIIQHMVGHKTSFCLKSQLFLMREEFCSTKSLSHFRRCSYFFILIISPFSG